MPAQKQICYVMPYTENFREERPRLCWEYMYGWIDGYGVCFDPVIQKGRTEVPLFCNGAPESVSEDQFYITSCREATLEFFPESVAGLFLCPDKNSFRRESEAVLSWNGGIRRHHPDKGTDRQRIPGKIPELLPGMR